MYKLESLKIFNWPVTGRWGFSTNMDLHLHAMDQRLRASASVPRPKQGSAIRLIRHQFADGSIISVDKHACSLPDLLSITPHPVVVGLGALGSVDLGPLMLEVHSQVGGFFQYHDELSAKRQSLMADGRALLGAPACNKWESVDYKWGPIPESESEDDDDEYTDALTERPRRHKKQRRTRIAANLMGNQVFWAINIGTTIQPDLALPRRPTSDPERILRVACSMIQPDRPGLGPLQPLRARLERGLFSRPVGGAELESIERDWTSIQVAVLDSFDRMVDEGRRGLAELELVWSPNGADPESVRLVRSPDMDDDEASKTCALQSCLLAAYIDLYEANLCEATLDTKEARGKRLRKALEADDSTDNDNNSDDSFYEADDGKVDDSDVGDDSDYRE
jgi:hypothetical protein